MIRGQKAAERRKGPSMEIEFRTYNKRAQLNLVGPNRYKQRLALPIRQPTPDSRFRNFNSLSSTSIIIMVKVQIVEEKDAAATSPYASSDESRTNSTDSLSSIGSDISQHDESFFDRVAALVDIVPPTTRHTISSRVSKTASFLKGGGKLVGNIVWVVTTSALLVALPLALSLEDEAKVVAQEKEMLEQQAGAQQVKDRYMNSFCPC
jgi:mitochondrial import receptor subunit TOM22